jgi:hypothetical protein
VRLVLWATVSGGRASLGSRQQRRLFGDVTIPAPVHVSDNPCSRVVHEGCLGQQCLDEQLPVHSDALPSGRAHLCVAAVSSCSDCGCGRRGDSDSQAGAQVEPRHGHFVGHTCSPGIHCSTWQKRRVPNISPPHHRLPLGSWD